jgi:hypothetical protein
MSEGARLLTLGTISGGSVAIAADVTNLGSATPVKVTLSTDYTLANPRPPGFPTRPGMTGAAFASLDVPGELIPSGTTIATLQCEATALINAGAGTLA